MKTSIAAVIGLLLVPYLAMAQAPEDQAMPDNAAIMQILADRIDRDQQGVGMATSLVEGSLPRFVAHGSLAAGKAPVDEHTLFEIGSITKIFTNLLLADMVLRGGMTLDDPVVDYLPADTVIPERGGKQITLFDLATHSSGLPRMPTNFSPADQANPYPDYGADQLYSFLAGYALPRDIGTQFEYSNLGTALLGQAIVTTSGIDYASLVRTRILEPLGMTDTTMTLTPEQTTRFATGHDRQLEATSHWDFDVFAPAGAYRSSAADMAKFVAAASGTVPTPLDAAFALMLAQTRPVDTGATIGLGWLIRDHDGHQIVWHNGGTGGFRSFIGFDRASKSSVVVLSNTATDRGVDDIGMYMINADLPLAAQPKLRLAVDLDPASLDNYVGDYALSPDFVLAVTGENGSLFVQATNQPKNQVFFEGDHNFFYKVVDAQLSFTMGPDGKATSVVLHQNGQDIPGPRQK
ncbi:D-alanyl-D-alanine-carboxypeptidase/D-alanyl-D-alanine-endopeptidase [Devosia sp. UYZn731]|uniref:serine hydrolase n=1 Tax=Devosia sp. UYZn731 TaxID=3156345 RepID=UPI0033948D47